MFRNHTPAGRRIPEEGPRPRVNKRVPVASPSKLWRLSGMTTFDCPVPGCDQPATLTITPVNDGRLARSRERLVCSNGHDAAANISPPDDLRLTR